MPYKDPEERKRYHREASRRYREAHPERIKESRQQYLETHLEEARASSRRWRYNHVIEIQAKRLQHNAYSKNWRLNLKLEAFATYGGPVCACCGETHLEFLSIDHVNGGGKQHRKQIGGGSYFYKWLKDEHYPLGYRVLCMNCNFAIGTYGLCPHSQLRVQESQVSPPVN